MPELRVELYGREVGTLAGADWRTFDFRTSPSVFEHFSLGSTVLSESVPLVPVHNRAKAGRRRNFFAELLPEGRILTAMARLAGVPERDVVGFLRTYGRDVAGALQIYDPEAPGEPRTPYRTPADDGRVRELLEHPGTSPLANAAGSGKTSLAGVQPKIVLARDDGEWFQVHDGYPSTHIVKPALDEYPTMVFDEAYGAALAHALGLTTTATWLDDFAGLPALVVERYDRSPDVPGGRIHQEDFNQVLGAHADEKYQELGGRVSLRRIARVLHGYGDVSSLRRLVRQTVLAVATGDLDMHAKNLSLLHRPDETTTLAPAYDMVPLRHQLTDGRLALSIAGEYRHRAVTADLLVREISSWGVRDASTLVAGTLGDVRDAVEGIEPDPRAHAGLRDDIGGFVQRLLAGDPVG